MPRGRAFPGRPHRAVARSRRRAKRCERLTPNENEKFVVLGVVVGGQRSIPKGSRRWHPCRRRRHAGKLFGFIVARDADRRHLSSAWRAVAGVSARMQTRPKAA